MHSSICETRPTGDNHTARTLQIVSRRQNPCYDLRDVPAITLFSESNTSTFRFCRRRGSRSALGSALGSAGIFSRIQSHVTVTVPRFRHLLVSRFIYGWVMFSGSCCVKESSLCWRKPSSDSFSPAPAPIKLADWAPGVARVREASGIDGNFAKGVESKDSIGTTEGVLELDTTGEIFTSFQETIRGAITAELSGSDPDQRVFYVASISARVTSLHTGLRDFVFPSQWSIIICLCHRFYARSQLRAPPHP
jgi:hypothetical protein